MQESEIAKSRDRFQKAENRKQSKNAKNVKMKNVEMFNKKKQAFQDSTTRKFFQFERVEMKMMIKHDEMINSKIKHAIHRADSISDRRRKRRRKRKRERKKWKRERRNRE